MRLRLGAADQSFACNGRLTMFNRRSLEAVPCEVTAMDALRDRVMCGQERVEGDDNGIERAHSKV